MAPRLPISTNGKLGNKTHPSKHVAPSGFPLRILHLTGLSSLALSNTKPRLPLTATGIKRLKVHRLQSNLPSEPTRPVSQSVIDLPIPSPLPPEHLPGPHSRYTPKSLQVVCGVSFRVAQRIRPVRFGRGGGVRCWTPIRNSTGIRRTGGTIVIKRCCRCRHQPGQASQYNAQEQ